MGKLIVKHEANIGTITEIDIHGVKTVPCNITNGETSDPIDLPSGHYTATVTRTVAGGKITEEISFDINDKESTVYPVGLPPQQPPVKPITQGKKEK